VAITQFFADRVFPFKSMVCSSLKVGFRIPPSPQLAKSLFRVMVLDYPDHRLDSLGHLPEIHGFDFHRRKAEFFGRLHQVVDVGRMNQGLAGNAAEIEAIPSVLLFLDEKGFCASCADPDATVNPADPPPRIPMSKSCCSMDSPCSALSDSIHASSGIR